MSKKRIKVGDYVATCKLRPSVVVSIEYLHIEWGDGKPLRSFTYNDTKRDSKRGYVIQTVNNNCSAYHCGVHKISKETHDIVNSYTDELLKLLFKSHQRMLKTSWTLKEPQQHITYEGFVVAHYNEETWVYKYISIEFVEQGDVVFADGTIWECKRMYKDRRRRSYKRQRELKARNYYYIPVKKIL